MDLFLPLRLLRLIIYIGVCTIIAIFLNALQFVSFLGYPFSKGKVIRFNCWVAGTLWRWLQFCFETFDGGKFVFSGDKLPHGESAFVFANHSAFTDFYMVHSLAYRKSMLGNCKYFAKDTLKYIPFFGWGMAMMGNVMVKRNWDQDQKRIQNTFAMILDHRLPVWLVSYLEGSRITPDKLAASQRYAQEKHLPVTSEVMLPRVKGFVATIQALRGSHVTHVYDMTFGYIRRPHGKPQRSIPFLLQVAMYGARGCEFHINVKRFAISELPSDEIGLANWCYSRYERKDVLLKSLFADGQYPKETPTDEPFVFTPWV